MNSDKLLEDLESLVMNASKMPFSNKKMVEEEEILQIIDDLKESMPAELEQAKKVLAEKDKIISDAQHHAESMVAQAKDYIAKLTEESELVRQAQLTPHHRHYHKQAETITGCRTRLHKARPELFNSLWRREPACQAWLLYRTGEAGGHPLHFRRADNRTSLPRHQASSLSF